MFILEWFALGAAIGLAGLALCRPISRLATRGRLLEAMARGYTEEVAALYNLRLSGDEKTVAGNWLDAVTARDVLDRLEAKMAANDDDAVRALLAVRGGQLPDDLREAVEEWLGDDEDGYDDVPGGPPLRGEKLPITSCPTDKMPGSMSVLVFGDGNAAQDAD